MSNYSDIPAELASAIASYQDFTGDRVSLQYKTLSGIECRIQTVGSAYTLTQPGLTKTGRKKISKQFNHSELTELLTAMSSII